MTAIRRGIMTMTMAMALLLVTWTAHAIAQTPPPGLTVELVRKGKALTPREVALYGSTGIKSGTLVGNTATFKTEDVTDNKQFTLLVDDYADGSGKVYLVEDAPNVIPPPDDDDSIRRRRFLAVVLRRGATLTVDMATGTLTVKSGTETRSYVSESPLGSGTQVTSEELEYVPGARDPWTILQQTPGVLVDRINVGGNEAGQQAAYVLQGAPPSSSVWSVDGVTITDMAALGSSPTYYNFDSFEEIQMTTGGADASAATGGLGIKFATRSGGNEFHGNFLYNRGSRVAANSYLGAAPPRNTLFDSPLQHGASLGGPIVRDRLWVFGGYDATTINRTAFAADGVTAADFDGRRYEGKLTLSPFKGHSLAGSYIRLDNDRLGSGAGPGRAASSTTAQEALDQIWNWYYSATLTDNFFVETQYARRDLSSTEAPRDGVPVFQDRTWFNSFLNFNTERPQEQYRADASSFFNTGNVQHELRFGAGSHRYEEQGRFEWESGGFTRRDGQFPVRILTPINNWRIDRSSTGVYASDTLRSRNLTVDLGVRFDRQTSKNLPSQFERNPIEPTLVPGGVYQGGGVFETEAISPRLGMTYALGNERKTLLRASYSRFADQLGTSFARDVNVVAGVPYLYSYGFTFNDLNNDNLPGPGEPRGTGLIIGSIPGGTSIINANLRSPNVEEYMIGVSKRLGSRGLIGADVTRRRVTDYFDEVPLVRDGGSTRVARADDYILDRTLTGQDYDNRPYQTQAFRLRPGLTRAGTQTQNGDRETEYLGATFYFDKRLANRWMLRGHLHLADWTWSVPDSPLGDPNDLVGSEDNDGAPVAPQGGFGKTGIYMNSRWSYGLNGLYQIAPDRPWGFDVAASVDGREGYITPASATVQGPDGVTRPIQIGDSDRRLPNLTIVNVQISKAISLKTARLVLGGEFLNAMNFDTVLQQDRNVTSPTHRSTLEVLSPRAFRIGARISFR